jgi:hypothetical protein
MADENIGMPDIVPEIVPYVFLWSARSIYQVFAYLDMASKNDRTIWRDCLDQWYEARHLWVIDLKKSAPVIRGYLKCKLNLTTTMSAPPSSGGLNGPPSESQYL